MTSVSFEATAGQTEFQIPFGFISEAHLNVFVDSIQTQLFTVTPDNLVVLDGSFVILEGTPVEIVRSTPSTGLLANFAPSGTLRSSEVLTGFLQLLYLLQELLASAQTGLRKTLNGQRWQGEGLVLSNLGEPAEPTDGATKSYVDSLAGQAGVLPQPTTADIGKGIRIRGGGTPTYNIAPINGASVLFKIPETTTNAGGQQVPKLGTGATGAWLSNPASRMPFESVSTVGTPEFGSYGIDPNGVDVLMPRGTFEIVAEGPVRSLTATSDINSTDASAALVTATGAVLDIQPLVKLGRAGGSANHPTNPSEPFQMQQFVRLTSTATFTGPTRLNLRISGSTFGDEVVADIPWKLKATEVIL